MHYVTCSEEESSLHFLLHGDCLELMNDIPENSVDLILCDLPYGTTDCKWDSIIPFEPLWKHYHRIAKDDGAIVLFSAQPFTTKLIHSNFKYFRYCWYWKKNNASGALIAKVQPMRCVEDICVFYKKKPIYNPQGLIELDVPINHGIKKSELYTNRIKHPKPQRFTNYPKNLIEFKIEKGFHPTQKPVKLLEYLILTYTQAGDTVMDNCMGSGSTGVAAANTGRKFIGIEKDEQYFQIAKNRIQSAVETQNIC